MMLRVSASATGTVKASTHTCRAVLLRVPASRRVCGRAATPGKATEGAEEHHGLISVWEDKQLLEGESPAPPKSSSSEKHGLVSVWEDHEMKEDEKAAGKTKDDSILNHPSGDKQKTSSYDSEW